MHNDYDYFCVNWWGDRNPPKDNWWNRELNDEPTPVADRRCQTCRPYTTEEEFDLLYGDL